MDVPPGTYMIVTGGKLSADEAADGVFPPTASYVLIGERRLPFRRVAYTYLVDYVKDDQ